VNVVSAALIGTCCLLPQMDVVYEGPLQLTESQINTLLGYQNPINKFINWNITRSQVSTAYLLGWGPWMSQVQEGQHCRTGHSGPWGPACVCGQAVA